MRLSDASMTDLGERETEILTMMNGPLRTVTDRDSQL
jgi:hypothetical protein